MKNNSIYLILAVAAMCFASCDKNEQTNGAAAQDDRVAVQFTAGTLDVQPTAATRSETPWSRPLSLIHI